MTGRRFTSYIMIDKGDTFRFEPGGRRNRKDFAIRIEVANDVDDLNIARMLHGLAAELRNLAAKPVSLREVGDLLRKIGKAKV